MSAHAILSPSAAHRWLACPPSARFEEQIPEEASSYASEGTLAHELAALLLSVRSGVFKGGQQMVDEMLNRIAANPLYADEMFDHAEAYAAFICEKGGEILIERSYDLSPFIPLSFGTADATNLNREVVQVTDYKYGEGVRVSATANAQLMCYALGALAEAKARGFNPLAVEISIFQPRAGGSSSWSLPAQELYEWANVFVRPRAGQAIAGQGEFAAGDHCRFCRARTVCRAYYDRFSELKGIRDKREMTAEDTAFVLTHGPVVASWVKKVEEEAIAKLSNGQPVPGFKLVAGRGRRGFRNEDMVVDILLGEGYESSDLFNSKLKGITDLEKLVTKKRFPELLGDQVIVNAGSPQLAPEDDERPSIGATAADEYDNS